MLLTAPGRRPGPGTCLRAGPLARTPLGGSPLGPVRYRGSVSPSAEGGIEELRGLRPSRSLSLAISASSYRSAHFDASEQPQRRDVLLQFLVGGSVIE